MARPLHDSEVSHRASSTSSMATQMELELGDGVRVVRNLPVCRDESGHVARREGDEVALWGSTTRAAEILGFSAETIRTMIESGKLRGRRPNGHRYQVDILDAQRIADESVIGGRR